MVLNNAGMAPQAFGKAWRLALADGAIALDYSSVLTQAADPGDDGTGNRLLREIIAIQPHNLRALDLRALNEYQQSNDAQAVALWREMLAQLPAAAAVRQQRKQRRRVP